MTRPDDDFYRRIDLDDVTVADALSDTNFGKTPADYAEYMAFPTAALRQIHRKMADEAIVSAMRALADFYIDGIEPNYDELSDAAANFVDVVIIDHQRRIQNVYLKSYKSFVKGKRAHLPKISPD